MDRKRNYEGEISHLTTKAINLIQGNKIVMEYSGELEITWMRLITTS